MTSPSVLLTTDGTYPCYRGGVSVWCDQLLTRLTSTPFHIFAITYSPSHSPVFVPPPNVLSQQILPLWGTERPGQERESLGSALRIMCETTPSRIVDLFLPPFVKLIRGILGPVPKPEAIGEALVSMHLYFEQFDYSATMLSPEVWETFLQCCCDAYPESDRPSLEDVTTCMRWLQRFLAVVTVPLPQTDVVHASMSGLAGIPGVLQKSLTGSRFLITEHGIFLRELYLTLSKMKATLHCRRFLFRFYQAIAGMNYFYADCVSSLCEFNRKWQIQMGAAPQKIEIIPNGVDENTFVPRQDPEKPTAAPVVLTMARIYPLKGVIDLIRAAYLVRQKHPSVRFRILGEVGDTQYHKACLETASNLGLTSCIEWGQTNTPQTAYQEADLFCLPSISEAMPYAVLEAMCSGCPVVATDVGGVREMLGGTGLLVPPKDPHAMADALLSLLHADSAGFRRTLADRAMSRARSLYTIDKCMGRFREVYGRLTADARATAMSAAG
jgi:polysaccharide biosynthesis protein PelF